MQLYLGLPEIEIPEENNVSVQRKTFRFNDYYYAVFLNKFKEFSLNTNEDNINDVPHLVDCTKREEFLSQAVGRVLYNYNDLPDILVDCSSSSLVGGPAQTYKLAKMNNLIKSMPLTFTGTGGTEFIQALQLVKNMRNKPDDNIIMVASQVVVSPDSRRMEDGAYCLGDAAASLIVTSDRNAANFSILNMYTLQFDEEVDYSRVKKSLLESLKENSLSLNDIKWTMIHNYDEKITRKLSDIIPEAAVLQRDVYKNINFGAADSLITLRMCQDQIKNIGLIWSVGRFKTISYLLVSSL